MDELLTKLDLISISSKVNKKIQMFGYTIKLFNNQRNASTFTMYRIHMENYLHIMGSIPDFENIYQLYLELYQQNKLTDILPYLSKYTNEIVYRINMSMKTISKEILNIYHVTRKQQQQELYELLSDSYKKILYNLHGIYIDNRKSDFKNGKEIEGNDAKSITVHDVYYYIKYIPFQQLKQLYFNRQDMLNNDMFIQHMCKDCIFALTQTKLMFES